MGHALLNAEAITAVSFLCLLLWRVAPSWLPPQEGGRIHDAWAWAVLTAIAITMFWPNLRAPLLHDSYGLVYTASTQSFSDVARLFYAHPTSGDFFFRPVSYLIYWLFFRVAGIEAWPWHSLSLAVHVLNSGLVYNIARRLPMPPWAALCSALLFALHGSRPEAVAWAAARVDLFAACFVLLTVIALDRLIVTGRSRWYAAVVPCAVAALLSKESAYSLPLVAWIFLYLRGGSWKMKRPLAVLWAVCGVVFFYRLWVIGGIGGYGAASGQPTILHFSLLRTSNALFFREWGLLFFPVNWSLPLPLLMKAGVVVMAVVLPLVIVGAKGGGRALLAGTVALTVAAALPVQHLLLIGADFNGSRVLYLPVLGLALFWGVLLYSLQGRNIRAAAIIGLFFFEVTALVHNLAIWRDAARLSAQSCAFVASQVIRDTTPVAVLNLPYKWNGVYFLNNAFSACVMFNSQGALREPPEIASAPAPGVRIFHWDESTNRIAKGR